MSDPIIDAIQFLAGQLEYARHQPWCDEFLTDVEAAVRVMRGLARGPAEQVFLGPCGAPTEVDVTPLGLPEIGPQMMPGPPCDGDVYGRVGAASGRCKTCGAEYDQGERQIWLDDVRRAWLFTAKEIADAYPINVKTIRSWHDRGLLVAHGDYDGTPLLKLGEVLDLAAGDAARREEARAARARRMAAKASGEEAA